MATRVQRVREQQLLSVEFVSRLLGLSKDEYKIAESKGIQHFSHALQSNLINLFGVEYSDLDDSCRENGKENLGFARLYGSLSEKDTKELKKLSSFKEFHKRSLSN